MREQTRGALRKALIDEGNILLAYVFGSVARGEDGEGADIDVAILRDGTADLMEQGALAERLARAISFSRRVDLVDLGTCSPVLAAEVVRDGILLLERDPERRFDFEMNAVRRYEDTKPLRRAQEALLSVVARGRS